MITLTETSFRFALMDDNGAISPDSLTFSVSDVNAMRIRQVLMDDSPVPPLCMIHVKQYIVYMSDADSTLGKVLLCYNNTPRAARPIESLYTPLSDTDTLTVLDPSRVHIYRWHVGITVTSTLSIRHFLSHASKPIVVNYDDINMVRLEEASDPEKEISKLSVAHLQKCLLPKLGPTHSAAKNYVMIFIDGRPIAKEVLLADTTEAVWKETQALLIPASSLATSPLYNHDKWITPANIHTLYVGAGK